MVAVIGDNGVGIGRAFLEVAVCPFPLFFWKGVRCECEQVFWIVKIAGFFSLKSVDTEVVGHFIRAQYFAGAPGEPDGVAFRLDPTELGGHGGRRMS